MTTSGRLAYVTPISIDAAFIARMDAQGSRERRFRFAAPCVEGGCPQWTGDGCGIADMAVDAMSTTPPDTGEFVHGCIVLQRF
jgi:hypothetical protein